MFFHSPFTWATEPQINCLRSMGISVTDKITAAEADKLIKANKAQWAKLAPTIAQEQLLKFKGAWQPGMTRGEATELIGRLKEEEVDIGMPVFHPSRRKRT